MTTKKFIVRLCLILVCFSILTIAALSVSNIANEFLAFIMEDCDIFDYVETFEKITLEDINSALDKMFDEKFYTLATVYPINS